MSPILKRLRDNCDFDCTAYTAQDVVSLQFAERIHKIPAASALKLVSQHQILSIEYSALCNQLIHHLEHNQLNPAEQKKALIDAILLATLLERLYLDYLNVPREAKRFREHQDVYRRLLHHFEKSTSEELILPEGTISVGMSLSHHIRELTMNMNWYRLVFVRLVRLFQTARFFEHINQWLPECLAGFDLHLHTGISYLAWGFLMPRLLTNVFLLLKHTLYWPGMSNEEWSLGWFTRFKAQLDRRWFELCNDLVWVPVALLNCFVFVGSLAPVGAYISLGFFAYDMLLSAVRAGIELNRLIALQNEYSILLEGETDEKSRLDILELKDYLNQRMYFEIKRFALHFAIVTGVFMSMCLVMPAFATGPVAPMIGAISLLATSLVGFILTRYLENYRPKDVIKNTPAVVKLGLFAVNKTDEPMVSPESQVEMSH